MRTEQAKRSSTESKDETLRSLLDLDSAEALESARQRIELAETQAYGVYVAPYRSTLSFNTEVLTLGELE